MANSMTDPKTLSTLLAELSAATATIRHLPWALSGDGAIVDANEDEVTALCNRAGDADCIQSVAEGIVALVNAYPALREGIERLEREARQHISDAFVLLEDKNALITQCTALRTLVAQQRECVREAVHAMHEQVHPGRPARRGMVNLETFGRWCAVLAQEVPGETPPES